MTEFSSDAEQPRHGTGQRPRRRGGNRRSRAPEPPRTGQAAEDAHLEPDQHEVARGIALRKLTAAPQSRAMLEEAMRKKNVPQEVTAAVLDRFTEVGLIDDEEYARMLVRTRHQERHLARRALAHELRKKGIDTETAAAALEDIDDEDEARAALEFARRKARSTQGLDAAVRKRRLVAALGRRGFTAGTVYRVVDEVLDADQDELESFEF